MNTGGWIMMIVAVGAVSTLMGWCIWKVISTPESEKHLHSPADIKTPDRE